MQQSHDGKEIHAIIKGIEKLLIFSAPKLFLIRTNCKRNTKFCENEFTKYASARVTTALAIMA